MKKLNPVTRVRSPGTPHESYAAKVVRPDGSIASGESKTGGGSTAPVTQREAARGAL